MFSFGICWDVLDSKMKVSPKGEESMCVAKETKLIETSKFIRMD